MTSSIEVLGHRMYLDPEDILALRSNGDWEAIETAVVSSLVHEGDSVLDLGAHIGYYTLLFARLAGPEGRVWAFEPDPDNFSILRANVEINGYNNVVTEQAAVGDVSGKIPLFRSPNNSGDHRIFPAEDERPAVEVPCVQLDEYFDADIPSFDLVKMDLQGAEYSVLKGATSFLKKTPDVLLLTEFWPFGLRRSGADPPEYLRMLESLGFALHNLDEDNRTIAPIGPIEIEKLLEYEEREPHVEKDHTELLCVRGEASTTRLQRALDGGLGAALRLR